jgi:hypothetical protein
MMTPSYNHPTSMFHTTATSSVGLTDGSRKENGVCETESSLRIAPSTAGLLAEDTNTLRLSCNGSSLKLFLHGRLVA